MILPIYFVWNIKEDMMKIDNYSVAMNAQYFNLELESTQTRISDSEKQYKKGDSNSVTDIDFDTQSKQNSKDELSQELSKAVLKNMSQASRQVVGDRLEISHTYAEAQALNYSVKAFVEADGREIELSLNLSLSRSFVQKTSISIAMPQLMDPLVISLDGGMPSLSSKTFSFDIDSDGKSDQISQLKAGNGFLALDKNNNRKIDDGSELFGTKSGNGFADLKAYDDDNNGWIDENDAIFDKLRIWEGGKDGKLIALGEVGIGAIFLGNTKTPFSLKDENNQLLGDIRSSSFVLYENGKAGVISQVDLVINDETKGNLELLEKTKTDINISNLHSLYNKENNTNSSNNPVDDKIKEIQKEIKALEKELKRAREEDKPAIQARIGSLYAKMMNALEQNID